jgi:hypothetical protein
MKNRQWRLARRAQGAIQDSDFNFVETDAPTPGGRSAGAHPYAVLRPDAAGLDRLRHVSAGGRRDPSWTCASTSARSVSVQAPAD